jgi:serine/threonine-protein kinase RsbW
MKRISTLTLPARLEHLPSFIAIVAGAAASAGVDPKKVSIIELALEEALVNIMNYAYEGKDGNIELACRSDFRKWFVVEIVDDGKAFDITSVSPPDLTASLSERKIGGLGVYFIKTLIDQAMYRREEEKNVLELRVSLTS